MFDIEPWMLGMAEEYGYMDTNVGLVNRVAIYLADSSTDIIGTDEFRDACIACDVDPDSFTQEDLDLLQQRLDSLK